MTKKKPIKCSYCCFAIPRLNTTPLTYACSSPYETTSKCKYGMGYGGFAVGTNIGVIGIYTEKGIERAVEKADLNGSKHQY